MQEYTLRFVPQGQAADHFHFEAGNDAEALFVARRYLDPSRCDVWQVHRILERVERDIPPGVVPAVNQG